MKVVFDVVSGTRHVLGCITELMSFRLITQIVRSSPFVPPVASTLKEKMASFQSLMDVVEREACGAMPELDGGTGGCRTPLSGEDPHSHRITCLSFYQDRCSALMMSGGAAQKLWINAAV